MALKNSFLLVLVLNFLFVFRSQARTVEYPHEIARPANNSTVKLAKDHLSLNVIGVQTGEETGNIYEVKACVFPTKEEAERFEEPPQYCYGSKAPTDGCSVSDGSGPINYEFRYGNKANCGWSVAVHKVGSSANWLKTCIFSGGWRLGC